MRWEAKMKIAASPKKHPLTISVFFFFFFLWKFVSKFQETVITWESCSNMVKHLIKNQMGDATENCYTTVGTLVLSNDDPRSLRLENAKTLDFCAGYALSVIDLLFAMLS